MTSATASSLNVETRGDGPRLVLLHGWALNSRVWDDIVEPLAARFTVARVDLPGHGGSPWPPRFDDLESLARVLAPHLEGSSVIVGWSLGSLAALQLALAHSAAVRALVLVAGTPRFLNDAHWRHGVDPDVLEDFAERLRKDQEGTVRDFLALQVRGDERAMQTLRTLRRRVLDSGPTHPAALAAGLEVLKRADLRESLGSISVPALVIAGEHDRLTPAGGLARAGVRPEARALCAGGAGGARTLHLASRRLSARSANNSWRGCPPRPHEPTDVRYRESFPARSGARAPLVRSRQRTSTIAAAVLQARVRERAAAAPRSRRASSPRSSSTWAAAPGTRASALKRRFPAACVVALDLSTRMLRESSAASAGSAASNA